MIAIFDHVAFAHKIINREGKQDITLLNLLAYRRTLATEELTGMKGFALTNRAHDHFVIEIDRIANCGDWHEIERKWLDNIIGLTDGCSWNQRARRDRQVERGRRRILFKRLFAGLFSRGNSLLLQKEKCHDPSAQGEDQTKSKKCPSSASTH